MKFDGISKTNFNWEKKSMRNKNHSVTDAVFGWTDLVNENQFIIDLFCLSNVVSVRGVWNSVGDNRFEQYLVSVESVDNMCKYRLVVGWKLFFFFHHTITIRFGIRILYVRCEWHLNTISVARIGLLIAHIIFDGWKPGRFK